MRPSILYDIFVDFGPLGVSRLETDVPKGGGIPNPDDVLRLVMEHEKVVAIYRTDYVTGHVVDVTKTFATLWWDKIQWTFNFHEELLPQLIEDNLPAVATESTIKYKPAA